MLWRGGFPAHLFCGIPAYAGTGLWDGMCMGPCWSPSAICSGDDAGGSRMGACSLPGGTGWRRGARSGFGAGGVVRVPPRGMVFLRFGGRFAAGFFLRAAGLRAGDVLPAGRLAGAFFFEPVFFFMAKA